MSLPPVICRLALLLVAAGLFLLPVRVVGKTIRIATYNIENYLIKDRVVEGRWRPQYPKPEVEKSALREVIRAVDADILALQEVGPKPFLRELRRDLENEGLAYPFWHLLEGEDEVRHLAVLSKRPFVEVWEHRELDFPYFGEREKVRRGVLEVVFEEGGERWSLFIVHLKSKWTESPDDPEAEKKRVGEATAVRDRVLERYDPERDFYLVAGDLNDGRQTATLRRFLRRGEREISRLIPAEDSRGQTWTQHWSKQGIYSQFDYLLASPALFDRWSGDAGIFDGPDASIGSDHRLVWADFRIGVEAGGWERDLLIELYRLFRQQ